MVFKIKLRLMEMSTNHLQGYHSLVEIASAIFGGKKDNVIDVNDLTPEDAVKGLNNLFEMAGQG